MKERRRMIFGAFTDSWVIPLVGTIELG